MTDSADHVEYMTCIAYIVCSYCQSDCIWEVKFKSLSSFTILLVANGKFKTLWDSKCSIFLCETLRQICKDQDSQDSQIFWKLRLLDPWNMWNLSENFQGPKFLKDHLSPLILACIFLLKWPRTIRKLHVTRIIYRWKSASLSYSGIP